LLLIHDASRQLRADTLAAFRHVEQAGAERELRWDADAGLRGLQLAAFARKKKASGDAQRLWLRDASSGVQTRFSKRRQLRPVAAAEGRPGEVRLLTRGKYRRHRQSEATQSKVAADGAGGGGSELATAHRGLLTTVAHKAVVQGAE